MGIKKVLIVHSYANWGGNLKIVHSIIDHLIKLGLNVGFAYPRGIDYIDRFKDLNIIPVEYNWKNKGDIAGLINFILKIKRFRPHLLHSHSRQADLITAVSSFILSIPAITTQHAPVNIDEKTFSVKKDLSAQIYRLILRIAFKKVIIVSRYLADEISKEALHIPEEKIVVIPNGIAVLRKKNKRVRKELGIGDDVIVITEIGTIAKKGHIDLVRAGRSLIDREYNVKFIIAGVGREENDIKNLVESMKLSPHFYFLGFREDIVDILSSTDIFILPSYSEGLPISILEAMCLGKPIISTPVGGIRDAVINGQTGIIVNTNSPVEIADAISTLIDNEKLRKELGENAERYFHSHFTIERMMNNYTNLYRTLLKF
jgi:glycosyltransferase involved in cell wall biosynthesis